MKKISILSLHLGYGGIEKSVVTLANSLCSRYEVEIATCYKLYDKCVFDLDSRVKVKYLNKDLKPNHAALKSAFKSKNIIKMIKESSFALKVLYKRKKSIVKYIRTKKCDVIISTRDIFNYWLGAYGEDNVLKIGWEHNHFHEDYKYATNVINSAKGLDYLVLVSSDLNKFYSRKLKNSNCTCVYIPNSIEKIPKNIAPLNKKSFVSVGRLSPEKGYLDLLKLYKLIKKKYPDWVLNIIGDGPERKKLEEFIKDNDLEENVILHGYQGKDYIDKVLHNSSIYLMTSYTESFGIVLIEAMSHGVPCVAFDSAEGAREIINSGENGYLIKNRNFNAMLMKISSLVDKETERKKLGKMARESVKKYSSDIVVKDWFTLIEESDDYE
ncbi:MAG: glycosyltransferase family 4 protein [Bacilli bacterium]|nr:glycosyltransferase family 4 protein [Bacilli bacterium]